MEANIEMVEGLQLLKQSALKIHGTDTLLELSTDIEAMLHRFLIARDGNPEDALKMLNETIIWRKDNNISTILKRQGLSMEKKDAIRQNYVSATQKYGKYLFDN